MSSETGDSSAMEKGGVFGWFNRGFKATTHGYEGWVARILRRTGRMLVVFGLQFLIWPSR